MPEFIPPKFTEAYNQGTWDTNSQSTLQLRLLGKTALSRWRKDLTGEGTYPRRDQISLKGVQLKLEL
jgi:hypothetical protein